MIVLKRFSSLERYEKFDDKKLAKLTEAQKRMILEDERAKARRNAGKIVKETSKKRAAEGKESGRKKGKKRGTIVGGILGTTAGLGIAGSRFRAGSGPYSKKDFIKDAAITLGGGALGAVGGRYIGGSIGEAIGEENGRLRGAAEGKAKAKKGGHDEVDVITRHARSFDDYARRKGEKGKDTWELNLRDQLKAEKEKAKREAARRRAEELERRRVAAEEREARAREREADARYRDSVTNRERYKHDTGKNVDWWKDL